MAAKLEGTDRGLDAVVGLVIVITGVVIGAIAIGALYEFGTTAPLSDPEAADVGYSVAVVGSIAALAVATLVYLVRVAVGRRSFTAPLWGVILMTVAIVVGWLIMSA